MSWDVFVQDLPKNARSVEDIPQDFRPNPILPRSRIFEVFKEVAPFTDFSDPNWWRVQCDVFSIEVNINAEDPSCGFTLHIRGSGEAAGFVSEILQRLGVRALDSSSDTGLFDFEKSNESFRKWQAYRDYVANKKG
jgi:hypothetical protein